MSIGKTITITSLLSLVVLASSSCAAKAEAAPEYQTAVVQRGDLMVDITAVGNLALSHKEELAFEMAGDVAEVLVEAGDAVEAGQLLAKLDTSAWEEQLSLLEDKVTTAERSVTAKERALPVKERDVVQAQINLKNAEIAVKQVDTTYSVSEFMVAQAEIDKAELNLEETRIKLSYYEIGSPGYAVYQGALIQAQLRLDTAKNKLKAMVSGFDSDDLVIKKLQVVITEGKLREAQEAVEDARIAIGDAEKAREDAREALNKARQTSPEIVASFTGLVTQVNVKGGDEVKKGTVAVTLADPNNFEADILVNETDIMQVKLGGNASVQVEAVPGMSLPAKVTQIAPTATIQSGVVNFKVKVGLASLQSVMQARQQAMSNLFSGNVTSPRQPTSGNSSRTISPRQGGMRAVQGQIPATLPNDFQLREGQTVTVSILVAESNNVLLVPNGAITRRGVESIVKVLKDGVVGERSITTGISDWQYTEITSGLSEGENVVITKTTTTTATTPSSTRGGLSFLPGRMR